MGLSSNEQCIDRHRKICRPLFRWGVHADIQKNILYQLSLMYLPPDNPQASRDKAIGHLRRLLAQVPDGPLNGTAARHLDQALNQSRPE